MPAYFTSLRVAASSAIFYIQILLLLLRSCLTNKSPLSAGFVQRVDSDVSRDGNVKLFALVRFRFELQFATLFVERKPLDVHRTVRHRQLKLLIPDARAVGENFYLFLVATRLLLLRTDKNT